MLFKFWFNGLPFNAYAPTNSAAFKFWFNGLPFTVPATTVTAVATAYTWFDL